MISVKICAVLCPEGEIKIPNTLGKFSIDHIEFVINNKSDDGSMLFLNSGTKVNVEESAAMIERKIQAEIRDRANIQMKIKTVN